MKLGKPGDHIVKGALRCCVVEKEKNAWSGPGQLSVDEDEDDDDDDDEDDDE